MTMVATIINEENLRVINNPVTLQNLCTMRDEETSSQGVRIATRKITRMLLYEASKGLPLISKRIKTPVAEFDAQTIDPDIKIIISPILRAGLIFTDEAIDILPQAIIRHVGMYRDEKTLKPVWYYNKLPKTIDKTKKTFVYITDPMLATGNSLSEAINLYISKGVKEENIRAICIIAAPEGLLSLQRNFPKV